MRARNIVVGQSVGTGMTERSRELRREMTPGEQVLWKAVRGRRFAGLRFRRQQIIGRFIVDFYCHSSALVVEVDGSVHADQVEYDQERDALLRGLGLRVLRVSDEEVRASLPSVLDRIAAAVESQLGS